jgi:phosphoribosylaminoimidazolecarboxamide formyltransferase / IMP cyclohydrolase
VAQDLKKAYRTIEEEHFPPRMEISYVFDSERTTLIYEKVTWEIEGERKGLRYGENPGQEAALYKLVSGNLMLGDVTTIAPGRYLVSDAELLQFGKHPGKINLTDADNALNILRYLPDRPAAAIMKHNNPSGVALGASAEEAYIKADLADHIAAFGGCVALNQPVDKATAEAVATQYAEVIVAPDYEEGAVAILAGRKNLRIMRIGNMTRLRTFASERFIDLKSLVDGALIAQLSFVPQAQSAQDLMLAETVYKGETHRVERAPTQAEIDDMLFGWIVEAGVSSNSVLYAKQGVTVGIGAGEQDRVGVAVIARDKAYRNMAERLAVTQYDKSYRFLDSELQAEVDRQVQDANGDLRGAVMVSDAFFPFRDGVDVGLQEGVTAIIQPGGSLRDFEVIDAVNEAGAAMVFTGQRSFKH